MLWLKKHPQIAPRIGASLDATFRELARHHQIDSLLPIPLHPDREAARGFNQAAVIAELLSRSSGLPIDMASLVRISATTRHRAGMDAAERARSLRRAFHVRALRRVRGRGILLVDDLMTTGATAHEVAAVLCEAGAREVCILTMARVISAPLWGKRLALA
ncbi:MAG: phosphoribosyltransferase family protein [Acidobacteriota bacterium]